MPKRTASYRQGLLERLTDPDEAANYLEAAEEDSTEALLAALRDVAEASKMAKVAKESGVAREALYRMLRETGNPTLTNFKAILKSVGVKMQFGPIESPAEAAPNGGDMQAREVTVSGISDKIDQVDLGASFTSTFLIGSVWESGGQTGGLVSNTFSGTERQELLMIGMKPTKIISEAMQLTRPHHKQ